MNFLLDGFHHKRIQRTIACSYGCFTLELFANSYIINTPWKGLFGSLSHSEQSFNRIDSFY
ncbi:hypothetical protein [Haemophilus parahaemolyticus]